MQRSQYRDRFQVITSLATRTIDLRRALLDHRPTIVHFSGHGMGDQGLVLENEAGKMQLVSTDAIAQLFGVFEVGTIECVLLNACYSEIQAVAIHQFVDCVIGMNQPIGDNAAVRFAEGFYDALGSGSDYAEAYNIGCSAIALDGSTECSTPVLKHRKRRPVPAVAEPSAQVQPAPAAIADPLARGPLSQSIGNITIRGNNNPVNAINSAGQVTLDQSMTHSTVTNPELQSALIALGNLKQAIATTDAIDETEKAMVAIPLQKLETELQKPQPERSVVDKAIATLKKMLDGVIVLAEPVTTVAALVAKAWLS